MAWPIVRRWMLRDREGLQQFRTTSELSEYRIVCLLGAAGLGKSWEIEHLAQHEKSLRHKIALLSLGNAATSGTSLRGRLDRAADEAGDDGSIFLDALDEAMVTPVQAAGVIETWIHERLGSRARLRIACRSAVWPGIVQAAINGLHDGQRSVVAELQPLSMEDVRQIASTEGLDAEHTIAAISQSNVEVLARQPLTLQMILAELHVSNRISSTRHELFDKSVDTLCTESAERRERGTAPRESPAHLREAAERLALYSTTVGCDVIDLNDGLAQDECALHWRQLSGLPAFNGRLLDTNVLEALKSTRLFVSAGDRRFRFLHRQYAEFLAGRRIANLPLHQARSLLAADSGWRDGVAGPLRETAAVAASHNSDIAAWISTADPEVIGRSDVACDTLRRRALHALLEQFRQHRLTDAQLSHDRVTFEGLRYDDVDDDLRAILNERGEDLEDIHAFVIELVKSWQLDNLADELADLVLDAEVPMQTRTDAGYALARCGNAAAKHRLLPLIHGVEGDDREQLKGLALRCNWPDNLSTPDLLNVLSTPVNQSFLGAYEGFLYELDRQGFDAAGHPIPALKWAATILSQGRPISVIRRVAANVALATLDALDQPAVLEQFIECLIQLDRSASGLFTDNRHETIEEKAAAWKERLQVDTSLRRNLLTALASQDEQPHIICWVARDIPGLAQIRDFPWLIAKAVEADLPGGCRQRFAELASSFPWMEEPECVNAWIDACEVEPVKTVFSGVPRFVELNSELAQHLRSAYYSDEKEQRDNSSSSVGRLRDARIQECLERIQADPRWFAPLVRCLALPDNEGDFGFERFVTKSPGWATADEPTKQQIAAAARRLLTECGEIATRCRSTKLNSILGDGGMPAIFLLMDQDRGWIEALDPQWWERWCWYVLRELHFHLHGEEDQPKQELLQLLFERARDGVRREIMRLARRKDGHHLLGEILSTLDGVPDDNLDDSLCDAVARKSISGEPLGVVMKFVLRRCPAKAVPECVKRLAIQSSCRPTSPAVLSAIALFEERPVESWGDLMAFFQRRYDIAKLTIQTCAYRERMNRQGFEGLRPLHVGQLLELMFTIFPPEDDPPADGNFRASENEMAVQLRGTLLNLLAQQADPQAEEALGRLNEKFGKKYRWLRRPLSEARRRLRLSHWDPIPLVTTAEILTAAEKRLVRSVQDVVDGMIAALERYDDELQHGTPQGVEDLWNRPSGNPPSPKDESHISDKISRAIREEFRQFAIVASREVQLRRRVVPTNQNGVPGSFVDIYVSSPGVGSLSGTPISVLVEVKRSCNPEAKTGLREQLVDRYLPEGQTDCGVFVVAYLNAGNLARHHRPQWPTLDEARSELKSQAAAVVTESAGTIQVESFVLDARLT